MHSARLRGISDLKSLLAKHARSVFVVASLLTMTYLSAHYLFVGGRVRWPIDFKVFWLAGSRPLYDVYGPSEMPFVYPPTSLFLFKPFSLISFLPSYFVWVSLSATLFGFAVAKTCGMRVSALSFLSPASNRGIMWGQSALLLSGALFAALRLPPFAMGAAFGLVAAVKPQLVLLAPIAFIVRREWKVLGGMATAWIFAVLASLVIFGPALWVEWVNAFPHFHSVLIQNNVLSMAITPAGRAEYLGLPVLPVLLASVAVSLTAISMLAKRLESEMLVAVIVAASITSSPYAHTHDTVALIPACIILLRNGNWLTAICAAFVMGGTPTWTPVALLAGLTFATINCRQRPQNLKKVAHKTALGSAPAGGS